MEDSSLKHHLKVISLFAFMCIFSYVLSAPAASAVEIIRNGDFSAGMEHWNIEPDLKQSWKPVAEGKVNLDPPYSGWEGYYGTIIYQNLNVTSVSGKTLVLSMDLYKTYEYIDDRMIYAELSYKTGEGEYEDMEIILFPSADEISNDPATPTTITVNIDMPAGAQRIVKLSIVKDGWGAMIADNISLTGDGVITGDIPVITSLSKTEGPYGTSLDITGENFGSGQGIVCVGVLEEEHAGVTINSWSDTSVNITISDPARSGLVYVLSDYVANDIGPAFQITSPNYTMDLVNDDSIVVKGQAAEYVIRVDFYNDFETSGGITFSVGESTLPQGAVASFTPVPLKNQGGVLLKIDTTNVDAGDYDIIIQAQAAEAGAQPRKAEIYLDVVTIQDINFYENEMAQSELTAINNTTQGEILQEMYIEATDNTGGKWNLFGRDGFAQNSPLSLSSSDSDVIRVFTTPWGTNVYALKSGNASITVTASDGTVAQLPVTTTLSDPMITSISVTPSSISYDYEGLLNFSASASSGISWTGYWVDGTTDFMSTFGDDMYINPDNNTASDTFQLGQFWWDETYHEQQPAIITVGFYAETGDATGWTFLDIVPGSERAQIKGGTRKLDSSFGEHHIIEFYNESGEKVYEREIHLMHTTNFHLGDIPLGTYRIRLVTEWAAEESESDFGYWYPNAESFDDALPVVFNAGETVEDIYFFIKNPDPEPEVNYLTFSSGYLLDFQLEGDDIYDIYKVTVTGPAGTDVTDFNLTEDENEFWNVFPSTSSFLTDGFPDDYKGVYTFTASFNHGFTKTFTFDFQPGALMNIPQGVTLDITNGMLSWNSVTGATKYYLIIYTGEFPEDFEEVYDGDIAYDGLLEDTSFDLFTKMKELEIYEGNYKVIVVAIDDPVGNETFSDPIEFSPVYRDPVPNFGQAITVMKILTGLPVNTDDVNVIRDVNADGKIGAEELIYIIQTNAGLRKTLPAIQSGNVSLISRAWYNNDGMQFSTGEVKLMYTYNETVWNNIDFYIETDAIYLAPGVGILDMGVMSLDSVRNVPSAGYIQNEFFEQLYTDHVYAFKLANGTYAVIQFDELLVYASGYIRNSFNYKYQPDGSTSF